MSEEAPVQTELPAKMYKIWRRPEWDALNTTGKTRGAPIDVADGYIHFSTAKTVAATLAKYFGQQQDLIIASYATDSKSFGTALKWEAARDGDLFPHLYAPLAASDTIEHAALALVDSIHELPDWVK